MRNEGGLVKDNFRADVEGLRAVAVLPIVLFHLNPALCPGGFTGVDIFFVISGFVITRMIVAEGRDFRVRDFYVRRFLRIFPALVVTIAITMIAAWRFASASAYVDLAEQSLAATFAASNFYFYATTDYFSGGALSYPLLHTWSLGVEEQFYLFWPVLLIAIQRYKLPSATVIAAVSVLSIVAMLICREIDPDLAFYMMPFRIFEFAAGAMLAAHPGLEGRTSPAGKLALGVIGAGLLSISFFGLDEETAWPNAWTLAPTVGTAFLIVAGGGAHWGRLLSASPLRLIGHLSYSLYLVHWPVIALYRSRIVDDPTTGDLVVMGVLLSACAVALHYGIERPFRIPSAGTVPRVPGNPRIVGLVAGIAAVVAMAASTIQANGFPSRIRQVQNAGDELTFAGDLCSSRRTICAFGDLASQDVVYLVGDSHALNLVYGLDELFKANAIKGIALYDHGCLFLTGTTRFIKGIKDRQCAENVEQAYRLIERNARPVIWVGLLSLYRGQIAPVEAAEPLDQTEVEYLEWIEDRLLASLQRVGAQDRPVILFQQGYNTGVDIPRCLRTPGKTADQCQPAVRATAFKNVEPADRAVLDVKSRLPNITTLDPKTVFCPSAECTVRDGDTLYFRDTSHLTNEGSLFLVRGLSEAIIDAVRLGQGGRG